MKASSFLVLLSLAGCSSPPETQADQAADFEYQRADTRIRASEEFEQRKAACAQAGGFLKVSRSSNARLPSRPRELRMATCERRGGFGGVY